MGTDWRDSQIRYLVHFDDGGSGMRYSNEPLDVGVELTEGRQPLPGRAGGATAEPECVRACVGGTDRRLVRRR
jgi:hypothetical protein